MSRLDKCWNLFDLAPLDILLQSQMTAACQFKKNKYLELTQLLNLIIFISKTKLLFLYVMYLCKS